MHRSPIIEQYSPFPGVPTQNSIFEGTPAIQPAVPMSYASVSYHAPTPIRPAVQAGPNGKPSLPQLDTNTFQLPPGARRLGYIQHQMQSVGARQGGATPVQAFRSNASNLNSTLAGSPALPWSHQQQAIVHATPHGGVQRRPHIVQPGSLPGTALPAHLATSAAAVKAESPAAVISLQQVERKPSSSPSPGSE